MNFTQAYQRLQEIQQLLQSNEIIDIEQLLTLQKEAKICYELCQSMLKKAEDQLGEEEE